MTNEEIFDFLRTNGKKLSDWLRENFDMHTKIVITSTEIKIEQTEYSQPIGDRK